VEKAQKFMHEMLEEGSKARKYAIQLKAHDLSDRLLEQCQEHSRFMETGYKKLQDLLASDTYMRAEFLMCCCVPRNSMCRREGDFVCVCACVFRTCND